jgi:UDP-N-acetylmuramate--alanine ligase
MPGVSDQPWSGRRLHVLGIGGAGMSAYALAAAALGATVTGSDQADSGYAQAVREAGIAVRIGHDPANLPDADGLEVVVSTAIPADNPELQAARQRGIPVLSRAQLLAQLTAMRRTIAVAGAHGKTTTSSMIVHVLLACGLDPGYLIGGVLRTTGRNGAWGTGAWLVVEADESDGSFLDLDVDVAVVTNIELDHHARWRSLAQLRDAFATFTANARQVAAWEEPADVVLTDGGSTFTWRGRPVRLIVPGRHNARNAAAALEATALAGADPAAAAEAIGTFSGAGRRFERLGRTATGALVVDDYAHHPTEVAATIAAARTLAGVDRVVAVFQPHLYSRTRELADEFGRALATADAAYVLDVYPARERAADFPGVSGATIPGATFTPTFADAARALDVGPRDVVLVMGAGDVRTFAQDLAAG